MSNDAAESIQISMNEAQQLIKLGEAVKRLQSHADFQELVVTGYFHQEAVRLVHLKSDPAMAKPEQQQAIHDEMLGIGCFASYLQNIMRRAQMAAESIQADREELNTLHEEQSEQAETEALAH